MLWISPCNLFVGYIFFLCHGYAEVISSAVIDRRLPQFDTPITSEEESITCYGESPSWVPERKRYGRTLAEFCVKESKAYCYRDRGPTTVAFDTLLEFEWDRREDNENPSHNSDQQVTNGALVRDGEFHQLYREAEMCQIKCRCSDPAEQFNAESRHLWLEPASPDDVELVDGFRQEVWEWSFDRRDLRQRIRPRTQKAWWKIGLVSKIGTEMLNVDEPRFQYYTGSPSNQPVCSGEHLSPRILSLLALHTIEHYTSYTELCLHRYYGGNNFTNAGGICRNHKNDIRQLQFPWELQAPVFISSLVIDRQCRRVCWCTDPKDEELQEGQGENHLGLPLFLPNADTGLKASFGYSDNSDGPEDASSSISGSGLAAALVGSASLTLKVPPGHPLCSSQAGCDGSQVCGEMCQCRAFFSIDPVMDNPQTFFGRCVLTASIAATMQGLKKPKLGGRSLSVDEKFLGKKRSEMMAPSKHRRRRQSHRLTRACLCNGSYVSEACCGSPDGQVWEHPALKLGVLDL